MNHKHWRGLALGALGAVCLVAGPMASQALADPPVSQTSLDAELSANGVTVAGLTVVGGSCSTPTYSQPFESYKDDNYYTLAPGETPDNFAGTSWTLDSGAKIQSTRLLDGATGDVLVLPGGAAAISPPVCVQSNYPTARTFIDGTAGAQVQVGVVYANLVGPGTPLAVLQTDASGTLGATRSWGLSSPFQVHPGNLSGWQLVQFIFANTGPSQKTAELYDFYIDPRMSN